MKRLCALFGLCMLACGLALAAITEHHRPYPQSAASEKAYLGFDRNTYPGDDALPILRKSFTFAGYWLSPPSGEKTNTWLGKRGLLRSQGFGFLVLFRGPQSSELQSTWSESRFNRADHLEAQAEKRGTADASQATATAKKEGFPSHTIIFLDIEEGGRLPAVYHVYLRAWVDQLAGAGLSRWRVLLGPARQRRPWGYDHHRRRHPQQHWQPRGHLLGLQRCLSSVARMRFPARSAGTVKERHPLHSGMAVLALAAPQGIHITLSREVRPRWQLLRAQ